jgi:general L-amino acid transport system substrate-binding protein
VACRVLTALTLALIGAAWPAQAADILERVHASGNIRCGAEERPGIAAVDQHGQLIGLAVDVCRAVAIAVLGSNGHIFFRIYGAPADFDAIKQGEEDVAFLTSDAIAEQSLATRVVRGPAVFSGPITLMVPDASPVQRVADLQNKSVCVMIGSAGQRALEAVVRQQHLSIARLAFQEDVEMLDGYNVQRCQAVVGEATQLAVMRQTGGINHLTSRLLAQPLAFDPVLATSDADDTPWAALVARVIDSLIQADATPDDDIAKVPGLRPDWQRDVTAAVGGYGAMLQRNLTQRLGLTPSASAP